MLRGSAARQVLAWNAAAVPPRWQPEEVADLLPGQPVYDVLDFGAKGDGVTDDTAAINRAIAAANARPGIVYFAELHLLTGALSIVTGNNVTLQGRGRYNGGTTLRFA